MTEDLETELAALAERTTKLDETADLPRSKMPALFRAARAEEDPAKLALLGTKLGERLADRALLEPIVELARVLREQPEGAARERKTPSSRSPRSTSSPAPSPLRSSASPGGSRSASTGRRSRSASPRSARPP